MAKNKQLESIERQINQQEDQIKSLTLDETNKSPVLEQESSMQLSQKELAKKPDVYIKPTRTLAPGRKEKFLDAWKSEYESRKQYVEYTVENNEVIGEDVTLWSKPYPGLPMEEWVLPTNKPIWIPKYVAEQVQNCRYHKFIMDKTPVNTTGEATYYGAMQVKNTVNRLDAKVVDKRPRVFMGYNPT
jgi:hypothetical protein